MKDLKDTSRLSRSREADDDDASDEGEAPASRKTNHDFTSLLELCRKGADDVVRSEEQTASKLEETLADVYRLKEYTDSKPGARKKLERAYEKAQILSCPRVPWTAICPTGDRHGGVQHERDRKR